MKGFRAAQQAWDSMEHPDYYDEEEKDPFAGTWFDEEFNPREEDEEDADS